MTHMKIITLILAGGRGERFWPLSRIARPKQSLPLISDKPMILETYDRLKSLGDFAIVANSDLCQQFKDVLPSSLFYIEEPCARNTAPAIGFACQKIMHTYGDCIIFIETADHFYKDIENYLSEIQKACIFAEKENKIVLIGINPTEPHTGYGYIEEGNKIIDNFYSVSSFKEKPSLDLAKHYLKQGTFSWNSGMFIAKCSVLLKEFKKYLPSMYESFQTMDDQDYKEETVQKIFPLLQRISIDYGIMEKSINTVVLRSNMHWDDIGDFNAISRVHSVRKNGNYYHDEVVALDSQENIIISEKLVALIGVENLVVVDTPDALLICDRNETQKIRTILKDLDEKYL
ncbi:hypothetical protein NEF87_004241 [Candidatus Lokiarchaeum ossiferum]|uniref:Mannose-1-phosphate guanylyltransferase n=1 Tax=Candidatus Lokiarchaeum ossiferum TaxID=2951803 RepID=A0ABY6HZE0_9ARCH|nr:hypothetical protein NEF87_004241 [Candidatus Lokiarchaeum sp. B-35]